MDLQELDQKLREHGISIESYYLHGLYGSSNDEDKLALVKTIDKYSSKYECYFKERSQKHSIRIFYTEDEACKYILKSLTGS